MATRVHLADDHTMFRQGLQSILSRREGVQVVGSTATGGEAAEQVARTKPDVIVAQLGMQPKSAEGVISGLRGASPESRIVALTLWDNPRYARALSGMGIDACIHASSSVEELLAALGAASRGPGGGNAVDSTPRGRLRRLGDEPARGLSNRRIAEKLHISEATVKRHLNNVYGKIGVHSRNEAVRKALVEQWIGLHDITSTDGDGPSGGPAG